MGDRLGVAAIPVRLWIDGRIGGAAFYYVSTVLTLRENLRSSQGYRLPVPERLPGASPKDWRIHLQIT